MNKIILAGKVYTEPEFSHETHGKEFYKFYLKCVRKNGKLDILPVVSEKFLLGEIKKDDYVKIIGEIRTRDTIVEDKMRLEVKVFAKEFLPYEDKYENHATLEGYICRNHYVRNTEKGKKITKIVASHRKPNVRLTTSDYIPCVFFEEQGTAESLPLGSFVSLHGELQSRDYRKRLKDGTIENRCNTTYEFSVSEMEE